LRVVDPRKQPKQERRASSRAPPWPSLRLACCHTFGSNGVHRPLCAMVCGCGEEFLSVNVHPKKTESGEGSICVASAGTQNRHVNPA